MSHHEEVVALMAEIASLRAELDEVKAEGRQEVANIVSNYRAAARQDAEEKVRLREALQKIASEAFGPSTIADARYHARASLACRPQGEKS